MRVIKAFIAPSSGLAGCWRAELYIAGLRYRGNHVFKPRGDTMGVRICMRCQCDRDVTADGQRPSDKMTMGRGSSHDKKTRYVTCRLSLFGEKPRSIQILASPLPGQLLTSSKGPSHSSIGVSEAMLMGLFRACQDYTLTRSQV